MDLLNGYHSSSPSPPPSDDDDKSDDAELAQRDTPERTSSAGLAAPSISLRLPPPGALNSAPLPSLPIALLRSRGVSVSAVGATNDRGSLLANDARNGGGPVQGPAALCDPADRTTSFLRSVDPKTGSTSLIVANAGVDEYSFSKNRNAFQRGSKEGEHGETGGEAALAPGEVTREIRRNDYGYARRVPPNYGLVTAGDPSEGADDAASAASELERRKRALVDPHYNSSSSATERKSRRARLQNDRVAEGPLVQSHDDEITHGIWAPPSISERLLAADAIPAIESGAEMHPRILQERSYLAERDRQRGILQSEDNEKEKFDRMVERKVSHLLPPRLAEDAEAVEASTTFHAPEEVDYRGRSWTAPPSGVRGVDPFDIDDHACYVPKKCIFRFTGHEKGVHRIRLFPRMGHLLLSAGLDGACKVWSIEQRKCMRTYVGHSEAVRDVQFNNDGSKFISASFDRYIRLWNVESGEVLGTYTNRRVPYVGEFITLDCFIMPNRYFHSFFLLLVFVSRGLLCGQ